MEWTVVHRAGTALELNDASIDASSGASGNGSAHAGRRCVIVNQVTGPALVLGSTQPVDIVAADIAEDHGIQVARRRSGGGAVLLEPGDHVWVDLVVPAGDPLWDDDVGRASWWLGEAWAASLGGGQVHRGGVTDRDAARVACFAALGPGEVERAGVKVVGISQRRTRAGARFQCVAYRSWHPERLLALLDPTRIDPPAWTAVSGALQQRAGAVVGPQWSVVEDLVHELP